MADTENTTAGGTTPAGGPPSKKTTEKKIKNPRSKPSHPPTSEMVTNAIRGLKERGGSSLQAIKKYIAANYKVDAEKVAPFIKKYLKTAVVNGALVQTKGKGASGSFKLSASSSGTSSKQASTAGGEKNKKKTANKPRRSANKVLSGGVGEGDNKGKPIKSMPSPKIKKAPAERKTTNSAAAAKKITAAEKKTSKSKTTPAASATAAAAVSISTNKGRSPSKAKKSNKPGPTKKPKAPKPKTAKSASVAAVGSKKKTPTSPKKKK